MNYTKEIEKLEEKVDNANYRFKMSFSGFRPAYKIKGMLKTSKNLVKALENLNEEILKQK